MCALIKDIFSTIVNLFKERCCILCAKPFIAQPISPLIFQNCISHNSCNLRVEEDYITFLQNLATHHISTHICEDCMSFYHNTHNIFIKNYNHCKMCGDVFDYDKSLYTKQNLCAQCTQEKPAWAHFDFVNTYEGALRKLILNAKFHNSTVALNFLGKLLAYTWLMRLFTENAKVTLSFPDYIIPMPLHTIRLKERGYNQSILLAKYLHKECKRLFKILEINENLLPSINTLSLVRVYYTQAQSELSQKERTQNVKNVFKVRHKDEIINKHILLLDDIATTNASLKETSRVLLEAGARKVDVLVVAKTPH